MKKIMFISLILIIIGAGIFLELRYLSKENVNNNENITNTITYLEKETIETTINNINNLFLKNGINSLIDKEKLIIRNNSYYYQIYENINIFFKPLEFTFDVSLDTTYDVGIYYPKKSDYEGKAKIFLKVLIKSNNNKLLDEDIEKLIDNALVNSKQNKDIFHNGISLRYFNKENDNYKEFIIRRNYK